MNKKFISVLNVNCVKAAIVVAGISFTLFGWDGSDPEEYVFQQSGINELVESSEYQTEKSNSIITLQSNEVTTADNISLAFDNFCSKQESGSKLSEVCQFISDGIGSIKSEKVAIDGNVEEGLLNVSLKLSDGVILSINKRLENIDLSEVAFNIFSNRELLISDIMDIHLLSKYILSVQNKKG